MAHFAEIRSSDNKVMRVTVVKNSDVIANGGEWTTESEAWVAANTPQSPEVKQLNNGTYPETFWKQCSYNTQRGVHTDGNGNPSDDQTKAIRFNYPGYGSYWNESPEGFTTVKYFPSWVLDNSNLVWKAPVDLPTDEQRKADPADAETSYEIAYWDEDNQYWVASSTDGNMYFWNGTTWTQIV